jgi:peptide/nickel transport system substrate-binding protein
MTAGQSEAIDPTLFASALFMSGNISETLIDFDAESKMIPCLAESWEISEDGKVITFHLREGVKFSDGSPFTSADVVFSWDRALAGSPPMQDATKGKLDHYEAPDDLTFVLYLVKPNVNLLYHVCDRMFIVSKAAFEAMGEEAFMANPVATGPYKVVEFVPTDHADLAVNEFYWGEKPQIQTAHIVYVGDPNTRVAMLQSGEVDLITDTPWSSVNMLKDAGFTETKVTSPHAIGLQFGCKNPNDPWYNADVRKAINYALDKDAVITQIFGGVPGKAEWQLPYQLGYKADRVAAYPADVEKARTMLADAGFANGFDMPLYYSPEATGMAELADYVVAQLAQVGINVQLNALTFGPQWFDFMRTLGTDTTASGVLMWEVGGPGGNDPTADLFNQFYGPRGATFSTPELDALIDQAFETWDEAARAEVLSQAFDMVSENMPYVYVMQSAWVFMMKPNVTYTKTDGISSPSGILKGITIQ